MRKKKIYVKIVVGIKELRTPFFTATMVPVVLEATVARNPLRVFNAAYFMLTLITALCLALERGLILILLGVIGVLSGIFTQRSWQLTE